MTKEQIVALAIRLFSVFLFIYGIRAIGTIVPINDLDQMSMMAWILTIVFALAFSAIAVLLWFFPLLVARKLLPVSDQKEGKSVVALQDIDVIAFSVIGLWILATAIPDMVYWIMMWSVLLNKVSINDVSFDYIASSVSTVLELCIGLWLLVGAQGLRGVVRRFRHAGS